MSEIVQKYIVLNELFNMCVEKQNNLELNNSDMERYYCALDAFVEEAKKKYSNPNLNVNTAIIEFNSDMISQEELKNIKEENNTKQL